MNESGVDAAGGVTEKNDNQCSQWLFKLVSKSQKNKLATEIKCFILHLDKRLTDNRKLALIFTNKSMLH